MSSPTISTVSDPEQTFLNSLPLIDRLIAIIVRRHALGADEVEEFAALAKARLIDRNYAVIRKFTGRSSLSTYLATVLVNVFRDHRNAQWGRWRPSTAAKRAGPLAIRLEVLLYREGHTFREAAQILQSSGAAHSERELAQLAAKIPRRVPASERADLDTTDHSAVDPTTPPDLDNAAIRVQNALRVVIEALPPDDALVLRMRFWDDTSVADIARALGYDQKSLYRRLDMLKMKLRTALEARGIDRAIAADILSGESLW